jgi:hypothetical protein
MDLEQIKNDKTKEAEELFKQIGIDYMAINYMTGQEIPYSTPKEITGPDKHLTLNWTRLSINSSLGCIVE